jgi:SPFH domain / Band 7 family
VVRVREPGLRLIVPLIEVLRRVSLRIVTMLIQSQGIITRDNVSIDVSAVGAEPASPSTWRCGSSSPNKPRALPMTF